MFHLFMATGRLVENKLNFRILKLFTNNKELLNIFAFKTHSFYTYVFFFVIVFNKTAGEQTANNEKYCLKMKIVYNFPSILFLVIFLLFYLFIFFYVLI